ncbi:hypothetical protein CPLU01_01874 [Colletotrichum plurivorum]|uniref:Uncharacterized protein n=1 Tax=Colletotrichum plurivorum TaxID=2175906 RepID=A0A8H6KXE4_9PEZI|nr:hypothetical protein CPLU01_01874 [Colletotrichum plurivorum]
MLKVHVGTARDDRRKAGCQNPNSNLGRRLVQWLRVAHCNPLRPATSWNRLAILTGRDNSAVFGSRCGGNGLIEMRDPKREAPESPTPSVGTLKRQRQDHYYAL